jgi:hypothetical protein
VHARERRWIARIFYDSKQHCLGSFDTKQEAALAYDRAARQRGKNKQLNYKEAEYSAAIEAVLQAAPPLRVPRPPPPSGFYGVRANGKRWQVHITYGGKQRYLGTFDTKQEAALTYDREARQCGEDKALNYESIKAAEDAAAQAGWELETRPGSTAKKRGREKNTTAAGKRAWYSYARCSRGSCQSMHYRCRIV